MTGSKQMTISVPFIISCQNIDPCGFNPAIL